MMLARAVLHSTVWWLATVQGLSCGTCGNQTWRALSGAGALGQQRPRSASWRVALVTKHDDDDVERKHEKSSGSGGVTANRPVPDPAPLY